MRYTITFIGDDGAYTTDPIPDVRTASQRMIELEERGVPCTLNPLTDTNWKEKEED